MASWADDEMNRVQGWARTLGYMDVKTAIRETIEEAARRCDEVNDPFAATQRGQGINTGAAEAKRRILAMLEDK